MFVDRRLARYHFSIGVNLSKETCNAWLFGETESISPNCKTLQVALDKFTPMENVD